MCYTKAIVNVVGIVMSWGRITKYFTVQELEKMSSWVKEMDFNKALAIVGRVYAECLDKSGNIALCHFINVSDKASTEEGQIVGLLHDVVEDGYIDLKDLYLLGFSENIIRSVAIISRDKEKYPTYESYIYSVVDSKNFLAIETKLHDICDNISPRRILDLPEEKQIKALKKYVWALPVVYEALQECETLKRRKTL